MKIKPIILIAGDPKSIFFEIFFKAIKIKFYKSPLILICCKKILIAQMKKYKIKKRLNILKFKKLNNLVSIPISISESNSGCNALLPRVLDVVFD